MFEAFYPPPPGGGPPCIGLNNLAKQIDGWMDFWMGGFISNGNSDGKIFFKKVLYQP
jgi:hypothetical protein